MLGSMRLAERVQFFRELATLVDAGMSLGMALSTLEGRRTSMELKLATQEAARKVSSGQRLSDVMARHPRVFSELNRALVAAGEQGGRLDDMLNLSADYLERELEFHQTLSRETFYPKLVAGAVLFIPLITRMVITAITGSMGQALAVGLVGLAWYTLILGLPIVVVYVLVQRYGASRQGRIGLDRLKQRIPLVGPIVTKLSWARACRALSALYSAGVPINAAVQLSAKTAGNHAVEEVFLRAQRPLEEGKRLSEVLAQSGQIPALALSMLKTGEESGNIDATMNKVADYFEAEASTSLKKLTLAIVPVAVIVFGVVVLFQLVGFYQGYFSAVLSQ